MKYFGSKNENQADLPPPEKNDSVKQPDLTVDQPQPADSAAALDYLVKGKGFPGPDNVEQKQKNVSAEKNNSDSKLDEEIEEQPNTLVGQQLLAKKKFKQERQKKQHKKPSFFSMAIGAGVSLTEKMVFMDNMSTMLKAGLPLAAALNTLANETKQKYFKSILLHLKERVENGEQVSAGMKQYPKVFPEILVASVEVGESSGLLSDVLGHLANLLKAEKALKSKVFSALMYPAVVIIALIVVSLVLTFFVFPKIIDIFIEADVKLPAILIIVQYITRTLQNYGLYIAGGLIIGIFFLVIIFRRTKPKLWLHTILLRAPLAGRLIREIALTRFSGNLRILLASGLSIITSLDIVAKTVGNMRYRATLIQMSQELAKGIALNQAMAERPFLFPSITIQLTKVGEETGELENILAKISEFYDTRVNSVLANLSTLLEPILLIMVGVVVGFIAVSVIGPIYELTNSFSE